MVRRWLLLALLSGCVTCSCAQDKGFTPPDYKAIEQATKQSSSPLYYPKLFARYKADDTTLTVEQFKALYYGFFFQDGYSSFASSEFADSLREIYQKDKLTADDNKKIVKYTLAEMKQAPFSLRDLYRLYMVYDAEGKEADAKRCRYKLEMLSKAIASTGDARTDSTGLHVLTVEDEYTIIALLGYEFGGTQKLTHHPCDYLTLKPNDDHIEGLYFDVTQIFKGYEGQFKSDRDAPAKKK